MENLTVKELRVLARGFGLPTSELKIELVERINHHLLHLNPLRSSSEFEMPPHAAMQTDGNRVTVITKFKKRFIDPLRRFTKSISSTNPSTSESIPWISLKGLAVMLGFFGGIHSMTRLLVYFFGGAVTMTCPRNWWSIETENLKILRINEQIALFQQ